MGTTAVQVLRSPHLLGWLSPQLQAQPLPSNPTPPNRTSLLFSKPFQKSGLWAGTRNSHLRGPGPETHGLRAQCGAGLCGLRGRDLKPSHPRQRSSSWAGSSPPWKPVAVGRREEVRGRSAWRYSPSPSPQLLGSHLSFGHFFDGFEPLRGLVSHILLRGFCPGICLVRARPQTQGRVISWLWEEKENRGPGVSPTWSPPCPRAWLSSLYLGPQWCPGGCRGRVGGGCQARAGAVSPRPGSGSGPAC